MGTAAATEGMAAVEQHAMGSWQRERETVNAVQKLFLPDQDTDYK